VRAWEKNKEPFIFSLIRKNLPHNDQNSEDKTKISDGVVYGSMALVTLGILVWLLFVFSSAQ
jgi:hypothetical protein